MYCKNDYNPITIGSKNQEHANYKSAWVGVFGIVAVFLD